MGCRQVKKQAGGQSGKGAEEHEGPPGDGPAASAVDPETDQEICKPNKIRQPEKSEQIPQRKG